MLELKNEGLLLKIPILNNQPGYRSICPLDSVGALQSEGHLLEEITFEEEFTELAQQSSTCRQNTIDGPCGSEGRLFLSFPMEVKEKQNVNAFICRISSD